MSVARRSGQRLSRLRELLFPKRDGSETRREQLRPLPLGSFSVLCTDTEPLLLVALTPIESNLTGGPTLYAMSVDQAVSFRDQLDDAIEQALLRGEAWPPERV
jgi:hypothetical protein